MFTGNALTGKRRLCYGTHNVPRQAAFCGLTAAGRRRATEGRVHMGKRMLTSWLVLAMLSIAPGGLAIAQAIPPASSGAAADADPSADTQPGAAAHTQPETAAKHTQRQVSGSKAMPAHRSRSLDRSRSLIESGAKSANASTARDHKRAAPAWARFFDGPPA